MFGSGAQTIGENVLSEQTGPGFPGAGAIIDTALALGSSGLTTQLATTTWRSGGMDCSPNHGGTGPLQTVGQPPGTLAASLTAVVLAVIPWPRRYTDTPLTSALRTCLTAGVPQGVQFPVFSQQPATSASRAGIKKRIGFLVFIFLSHRKTWFNVPIIVDRRNFVFPSGKFQKNRIIGSDREGSGQVKCRYQFRKMERLSP
jgi:hypothetical protein